MDKKEAFLATDNLLDVSDRVANCALDHYDRHIPTKAKPRIDEEWTVYAAIVAEKNSQHEDLQLQAEDDRISFATTFRVISCATGTKCTAFRESGYVVHDGHAEVLARRGLVRVLMEELKQKIRGGGRASNPLPLGHLQLLEEGSDTGRYRLARHVQLHLYISDSPCGDGSIYPVPTATSNTSNHSCESLHTGAKVVVSDETGVTLDICGGTNQHLEGTTVAREQTQVLGKLRTKSGRSNIPAHLRSTSMSCSDKIVLWSVLGLQGGLLTKYLEPVRLSSVVCGGDPRVRSNGHDSQHKALERAITSRVRDIWDMLSTKELEVTNSCLHPPRIRIVQRDFSSGKATMTVAQAGKTASASPSQPSKKRKRGAYTGAGSPCGISMNWQQELDNQSKVEILAAARGVCSGKKPKQTQDYKRVASRLCRSKLFEQFRCINEILEVDYQKTKDLHASLSWRELKTRILTVGPMKGWIQDRCTFISE